MNYIKELRAFKDWLLLNELPTSAIALWHTLMAINNMTGWKSRFNAPNPVVEKLTGLSKQGLVNARIKLIEAGLIEYEKGKKGKAPTYKMISLVNSVDQSDYQSEYQSEYQYEYQSNTQSLTIPKHKQNINETKKEAVANAREDAVVFFEKNFGITSPFIIEQIEAWVNDFDSDEIVIAAMKIALKKGANSFGYCEPILKEWHQKGLRTIDAIRAYEANKQTKSKRINKRVEPIPKWMTDQKNFVEEPPPEEFEKRVKALESMLSNL